MYPSVEVCDWRISEPEYISIETSQTERQWKRIGKNNNNNYSIQELCNNFKTCNMNTMEIKEREEIENRAKETFKVFMVDSFPK